MQNSIVDRFNEIGDRYVEKVKALGYDPLGPSFSTLDQSTLHSSLVAHRILSKYEVPDGETSSTRKAASIAAVLRYDANGPLDFDYRSLSKEGRAHTLHVAQWLKWFFKGFKHSYSARFPTGEDHISGKGDTDLYYKLSSLKTWFISPDLLPYALEILYRDNGLRRVVKDRFKEVYGKRGTDELNRLFKLFPGPHRNWREAWRRKTIEYMFRSLVRFSRTSRVTTVPKNNKEDRVITCEHLWNMVCQLSFATSLRNQLSRKLGITLQHTQDVHRALLRAGKSTIDLSKASDSNWMCVLRSIWPEHMYHQLERMRSGIFEIDAELVPLRMFAPMGTGCTFEVMTITLLAHVRVLDPGGSVFGDDIMIDGSKALRLMDRLNEHGWVINETKSFVDGSFRESCGGFCDLRTQKFLLSYDFHRPERVDEIFIFSHKLLQCGNALQGEMRRLFVSWYAELALIMPRDSLRPITERDYTTKTLYDGNFHVPEEMYRNMVQVWETGVSRALSKFWQRRVIVQRRVAYKRRFKVVKTSAATRLYLFLRRGTSYEALTGPTRVHTFTCDNETGTPLKGVLMASVIT